MKFDKKIQYVVLCGTVCLGLTCSVSASVFTTEVIKTGEKKGVLVISRAEEAGDETNREASWTDAGISEGMEELQTFPLQEETEDDSELFSEEDRTWELFSEEGLFSDGEGVTAPVEEIICEARKELQISERLREERLLFHIYAPSNTWFEDGQSEKVMLWDTETREAEAVFTYEGTLPEVEDFTLEVENEEQTEEWLGTAAQEMFADTGEEAESFEDVEIETEAALAVEVTADRSLAGPGDTIHWHVCIQNTGGIQIREAELKISFSDGIEAVSVQYPESLQVIETGELYRIPQIAPEEILNLEIEGKVSEDGIYGSFWMVTTLSAKASGVESVSRRAQVEGKQKPTQIMPTGPVQTAAPVSNTPIPAASIVPEKEGEKTDEGRIGMMVSNGYSPAGSRADDPAKEHPQTIKENPKTSDDSPTGLFAVLLLVSAGMGILIQTFRSY